jgi:hypothetical protein
LGVNPWLSPGDRPSSPTPPLGREQPGSTREGGAGMRRLPCFTPSPLPFHLLPPHIPSGPRPAGRAPLTTRGLFLVSGTRFFCPCPPFSSLEGLWATQRQRGGHRVSASCSHVCLPAWAPTPPAWASPLRGWRRVPPSLPCGSGEGRVTRSQVTLPAGQPRPGNRLPCPTHKVPPHQNKKEEGDTARGGGNSESRVTAAHRLPCPALSSGLLRETQRHSSLPPTGGPLPCPEAPMEKNTEDSSSGYPAFHRPQRPKPSEGHYRRPTLFFFYCSFPRSVARLLPAGRSGGSCSVWNKS